jgi:hypothetical protein
MKGVMICQVLGIQDECIDFWQGIRLEIDNLNDRDRYEKMTLR